MGVTVHSMGSGFWVPIPTGYMHLKKKKHVLHFPIGVGGRGVTSV